MRRPEKHPDEVMEEIVAVATKHGYGLESAVLTWFSGIPNSEIMSLRYGDDKEDKE